MSNRVIESIAPTNKNVKAPSTSRRGRAASSRPSSAEEPSFEKTLRKAAPRKAPAEPLSPASTGKTESAAEVKSGTRKSKSSAQADQPADDPTPVQDAEAQQTTDAEAEIAARDEPAGDVVALSIQIGPAPIPDMESTGATATVEPDAEAKVTNAQPAAQRTDHSRSIAREVDADSITGAPPYELPGAGDPAQVGAQQAESTGEIQSSAESDAADFDTIDQMIDAASRGTRPTESEDSIDSESRDAGIPRTFQATDLSTDDQSFDADQRQHARDARPARTLTHLSDAGLTLDRIEPLASAMAQPDHAARASHVPLAHPANMPPELQFADENHPQIITAVRQELLPGGGAMQIRLDPPELGALRVTIELRDGLVSASFQTSNDEATRLLSHSLHQLKQALEAQGVSVERMQVQQTASSRSDRDSTARDDGQQGRQQSPAEQQSARQEQQRREMMQRLWRRMTGSDDFIDLVA